VIWASGEAAHKAAQNPAQHVPARPCAGLHGKKAVLAKTAKSLQVQALATICELAQVRRMMEPGGVEPPCRDGRYTASTCVVAIYSRPAGRLATTFLQAIADKCLASQGPASPLKPVRSGVQCPIGRQSLNVAVKPRVRTGCCQLRFLHHLLTREKCIRDTQRHTFPARSMPVGPDGW